MSRVARTALFGVLGLALSPATAAAQFIPVVSPPNHPLYPIAPYRFQPYFGVPAQSIYGRVIVGQPIPYYSPLNRITNLPFSNWYARPSYGPPASVPWMNSTGGGYGGGPVTSGYMSGGTIRSDIMRDAQREYERTQRDATTARLTRSPESARDVIYDQWAYERLGVVGGLPALRGGENQPEELVKALAADEEAITSGDALNHILVAVVAAEAKGGKGPSAFLAPQILDPVRFSGSPAADAVNLVRQAGSLPFPAAFDDPKLKDAREQLEKDFASAAAPLRDGKSADPAKLARLALTLQKTQEAATPVIRALPFEESTAARRFLNHFEKALVPLRAANAASLVSPAWAMDGSSVADLVKHMTKHKLLFGPAADGGMDSYIALHKALATYLFVLTQPPKK